LDAAGPCPSLRRASSILLRSRPAGAENKNVGHSPTALLLRHARFRPGRSCWFILGGTLQAPVIVNPAFGGSSNAVIRPQPGTVEQTGIDSAQLIDLTLKTLRYGGRLQGGEVANRLKLRYSVVD